MTETPSDRTWTTADVSDTLGPSARSVSMQWLNLGGRRAFHGPVRTLRCEDAVGLLRGTLESPGAGCVLVVDGGNSKLALLGDRLATLAASTGWAGLIVHAPVRDTAALQAVGIGVFGLRPTPQRGTGSNDGQSDVPVVLDGITILPGDYVFADSDGLVACEAAAAREFLSRTA